MLLPDNLALRVASEIAQLRKPDYAKFLHKVLPGQENLLVYGLTIPELRTIAARMTKAHQQQAYLDALPHPSLEENLLHGILINALNDSQAALTEVQRLLPYVDNWMVCDTLSPKAFRCNPNILIDILPHWLDNNRCPYAQRFACLCLMRYFLGSRFQAEHLLRVAKLPIEHHYVLTGAGWYLAEALIVRPSEAWPFLEGNTAPVPLRLTALQKAVESHRTSQSDKALFRKLIKQIRLSTNG
jgi:hypothetical protein